MVACERARLENRVTIKAKAKSFAATGILQLGDSALAAAGRCPSFLKS
jgi:hypothetical protein